MKTIFKKLVEQSGKIVSISMLLLILSSCEDLLNVEDPNSAVPRDVVFRNDATAVSAITGMYARMLASSNFASGSAQSITALASLSSDDFTMFYESNTTLVQFDDNVLSPTNSAVSNLWTSSYQTIYQANSAIVSLTNSSGLSLAVKEQLLGESLFVRAFAYFNLVNMFGGVPAITSIDYKENTVKPRASADAIYELIEDDLLQAQNLLSETYPSEGRVRPNKATATALLSRMYLYREDWINAEIQASLIITNPNYVLEEDLNNVFLATSLEAIWQLRPISPTINTLEGNTFIFSGTPTNFYLTEDFEGSFEAGDVRYSEWVRSISNADGTFAYPFKYKIRTGGPGSNPYQPLNEYSMVFRLAEQYLIRAEARAKQDKLGEAISDLDMIRERAGLPLISDINPAIVKNDLLLAIERERRSELFTEWGHRWFDMQRTGRATAVLGSGNVNWSEDDVLYPIPANEFVSNPFLGEQNPGY